MYCLKKEQEVGVHDKACEHWDSPVRLDSVGVSIGWRTLILTTRECGTCAYLKELHEAILDDIKKGKIYEDDVTTIMV